MTLRELEAELAARGFTYVRTSRDVHRLYRNSAGRFVVVAPVHGGNSRTRSYDPGHVREILKQATRNAVPKNCTQPAAS